jgi:hypothetical protein
MSKAKMSEAKPLGAIEGADLRLWSFKKAAMAKGPREDHINFTISPGDTLKIFMDQSRFKVRVCNPGTCIQYHSRCFPYNMQHISNLS